MRVNGLFSTSRIWHTARIALLHSQSQCPRLERQKKKVTHERRKADSTLSVFHVSPGKATKLSYEILNLAKEGETFGGTQSSGNGNTMPVVLYCALFVMAASQESMIC